MEEFVSGGAAKSELHFFKITPAALQRKGKKQAREQCRGGSCPE